MGNRLSWVVACSVFAAALPCRGLLAAEGNGLLATVDEPAIVTVTAVTELQRNQGDQSARVIVSVTGFWPPQDPKEGAVQAVVTAQKNDTGAEQEIGRFGIFPYREFRAADSSRAQRFGFSLPKELTSGGPIRLKVYLVPLRQGEGKGARLELGGAEIR